MTLTPTQPAGIGQRIAQRVVNLLLLLGVYLWLALGAHTLVTNPDSGDSGIIATFGLLVTMAIFVWQLVAVFKYSTTVGGKLQKVTYVDSQTGRPIRGMLLVKLAVQTVFEVATLGLVAASYLIGYRDGQHWFDRVMKVRAIDSASIPFGSRITG